MAAAKLVSLFYYLLHFANDVVTQWVSTAYLVGAHSRAFWGLHAKGELQSFCRPNRSQEIFCKVKILP